MEVQGILIIKMITDTCCVTFSRSQAPCQAHYMHHLIQCSHESYALGIIINSALEMGKLKHRDTQLHFPDSQRQLEAGLKARQPGWALLHYHSAGPGLRPEGAKSEGASNFCFCSVPLHCTHPGALFSFHKGYRGWCPAVRQPDGPISVGYSLDWSENSEVQFIH